MIFADWALWINNVSFKKLRSESDSINSAESSLNLHEHKASPIPHVFKFTLRGPHLCAREDKRFGLP